MVKRYIDTGVAIFRFLKAARNRAKEGMSKEQILDFARREFGEVSDFLRLQIDNLFRKPKVLTSADKTYKQELKRLEGALGSLDPKQPGFKEAANRLIKKIEDLKNTRKADVVPIKKKVDLSKYDDEALNRLVDEDIMLRGEADTLSDFGKDYGRVKEIEKRRKEIREILEAAQKNPELVGGAKEGIMATDEAAEIVKKRTDDIATGDVTGETSDLMKGLEDKMTGIKKAADELKEISDPANIMDQIVKGRKALDPRKGVVRAAAREILNKNKVKIGSEDPINVLRQMYGEKGLEAVDAVSDSLLDAQSYGEINAILRDNKLFDLVPKKTYGYDQNVVTAEKIRKSKEEHERLSKILDDYDVRDRDPNADGGIIGNLHLNRTGFNIGSVPKGFKLAKRIRDSKEYKDFIEKLFLKASTMIRRGEGIFKDLTQSQKITQHDNLTKEAVNYQKTGELPEGVHQYFGMNPEHTYAKKLIKMEEANVAALEKSREKVRNFKKLQEFDPSGRKPNAHGGLIDILKL